MKQFTESILKKFWILPKWMSLLKIFSQIGELITNQKNKKIQEIQLQRDQNKVFIAYEKISKTIESVINETQVKYCEHMIEMFSIRHENLELMQKLERELTLKIKSLEKSFNS